MFIRLIAFVLVILGAAGFFMPFWIGAVGSDLDKLELPLAEVSDVAVSNDGELFFALSFSSRIQKYSPTGEFIRGFDVNSGGGAFCLDVTESELAVNVARRDAVDEYDLSGEMIRQDVPVDEDAFQRSCAPDPQIKSIDYGIKRVSVWLNDADQPVPIPRRLWHFLAPGPFASWLMFVVGLFLIPEWRGALFAAFRKEEKSSKAARPRGWLLLIDSLLNIVFTLYALALATIGLLITFITTDFDDSGSIAFSAIFGLAFVSFTVFGIYKVWTSYDGRIRLKPWTSFEVGPAGAVAWKAFGLFLLAAFIFSVFYFGEKWSPESSHDDQPPTQTVTDQTPD